MDEGGRKLRIICWVKERFLDAGGMKLYFVIVDGMRALQGVGGCQELK